jgi:DNA-binding transcriptional ArsR family regulator
MTDIAVSTLRLDSHALQVLAHPLRSRLLTALRVNGPATATALAEALQTNTGATSYHLRKLASVGLVEETDQGRGRERWWRAATEMHGWTERDVAGDPDGAAAADWLRRYYLHAFIERYEGWLDVQAEWPLDWRDVAGANDVVLRLTPVRLAAFQAEFEAMYERYRDGQAADDDPDQRVIQVYLYAFPFEADPS